MFSREGRWKLLPNRRLSQGSIVIASVLALSGLLGATGVADGSQISAYQRVVELDFEPPPWDSFESLPLLRLPYFVLYESGLVIYRDGDQLMQGNLPPETSASLVSRVVELGFEELEPLEGDSEEWLHDLGDTVLYVHAPTRAPRELRAYGEYVNYPEKLRAIIAVLRDFRWAQAQPYRPTKAVLWSIVPGKAARADESVAEWPLPIDCLDAEVILVEGDALDLFISSAGMSNGIRKFKAAGFIYSVKLIPWLPDVDYSAEFANLRLSTRVCTLNGK